MDRVRASRLTALASSLALLAGCSTFEDGGAAGGGTSTLRNILRYGTASEPPVAQAAGPQEALDCPAVLVIEGRSAIRQGSNQVSISNVARECIERQGGSVAVKVGVEGRALLGPGASTGRFDVPVAFVIRRGDQVIASRVKRVSVAIAAGQTQAPFVVVESDMIVPAGTGEYDIEVGLGGAAPAVSAARPRGRRG